MAISWQWQAVIWGIAFALFLIVMWRLGDTLAPFVVGMALAYFLDPVADRLERIGLGRAAATAVVAVTCVLILTLILVLILPALAQQVAELVNAVPDAVAQVQAFIAERLPEGYDEDTLLRRGLAGLEDQLREIGPSLASSALASSMAVVDFVLLLVLAPVVAFYLLLDWDRMTATIDGLLPRQHADTVRRLAGEIDAALAGFVRGQFTVCLILGTFYAVALSLVGLPFGFLIGSLAGLLAFIPYVGAMVGGVLSVGVALYFFWGDPVWIVVTAAIFGFGQFVEGNILSPRLVGRSVGLHPVLLILALSVFGRLFGFAGLMVAVPAAAALGVLTRFAVERYKHSPLYSGSPPAGPG